MDIGAQGWGAIGSAVFAAFALAVTVIVHLVRTSRAWGAIGKSVNMMNDTTLPAIQKSVEILTVDQKEMSKSVQDLREEMAEQREADRNLERRVDRVERKQNGLPATS